MSHAEANQKIMREINNARVNYQSHLAAGFTQSAEQYRERMVFLRANMAMLIKREIALAVLKG